MRKLPVAAFGLVTVLALSSLWTWNWRCIYYPSYCLLEFPTQPKPCMPIGVPRDDGWR